MVGRAWMMVFLVASLAFAGCTSGEDPVDVQDAPEEPTIPEPPINDTQNETLPPPGPADAYRFTVDATPEGNVSGYWIELADDAWWSSSDDEDPDYLLLDVAFETEAPESIESWSILLFLESNGKLEPFMEFHDVARQITSGGPLGDGVTEYHPTLEPIADRHWRPNDPLFHEMYVVVAARGPDSVPLSVYFRPDKEEDTSLNDPDDVVTIIEESDSISSPVPIGSGSGYRYEYFFDDQALLIERTVHQTANVEVTDSGPEASGLQPVRRTTTLEVDSEYDGFSRVMGHYLGGIGGGTWSVSAGYDGSEWTDEGTLVELTGTIYGALAYVVLPRPEFIVQEEAATDMPARFSVDMVNVDEWEELYLSQLQFGTSMEHLTGVPPLQVAEAWTTFLEDG